MALPEIRAVITADTRQAEAGFDRVERGMHGVGSAADVASAKANALGASLNRTGGRSSAFGRGIQNASFQIGDFATQVGAGTSASIALGQQLPQLLGGFGIMGAVIGAVVAVAVPLTRVFQGMVNDGRDLGVVFGTLQPLAQSIGDGFRYVAQMGVQMADVIINNLDRILITAGTVAGFFAAKWVGAFVAARIATFSLSGALGFLRTAIIRTGIGALIIGAGEMVYQFTRLVQATGGFGEALGLLADVGREVFRRIGLAGSGLWNILRGVASAIAGAFLVAFSKIGSAWDTIVNGMASAWNAMAPTLGFEQLGPSNVGGALAAAGEGLMQSGIGNIQTGGGMLADAAAPLEGIQAIKDTLASIKEERITLPDLLGVGGGDEEGGSAGKSGGGSASEKLDEELTAQEERIKTHFDRIKALTVGGLSDKLGAWGGYFSNLASLTQSNNAKLLGISKSFAAAQALVDAWQAHNAVLKDPTLPWWARIASAANVLAAGIGAVNAIKSVNMGGTGGSAGKSGGAGGFGGNSSDAGASPSQTIYVNLQGDTFSRTAVSSLLGEVSALQSDYDRGARIIIE